jgi:hypothetical protein
MRRPVRQPILVGFDPGSDSADRGSVATVANQSHTLVSAGSIPAPATIFRSSREVIEFVEKFTYKPNCQIRAWVDEERQLYSQRRLFIHMVVDVPDSTTEEHRMIPIAFTQSYDLNILMLEGPRYVFHMMKRFVEDWERHESQEWLAFDGVRLVAPHEEPKGILNA